MENRIVQTLIFNKQVRLYLINNTKLIEEIININANSNTVVKSALAHSTSIASLLTAALKGKQRLSGTLILSNSKSKIHIDADAQGNVRGYASQYLLSQDQHNYESVHQLIGPAGFLRLIKGVEMNQFTGITDMPYRNIDKDFSYFFKQSEQTDTLLKTGFNMDESDRIINSYGIFAQVLPQASPHLLEAVEQNFDKLVLMLKNLSHCRDHEILQLLDQYFHKAEVLGHSNAQFFCGCSKDMFYGLLHSINEAELREYVRTDTEVKSTCHICGRDYFFQPNDIKFLLKEEI